MISHMVWCERKKCNGECGGSINEAYLSVQIERLERVNKIMREALVRYSDHENDYSCMFAQRALDQVREILKDG